MGIESMEEAKEACVRVRSIEMALTAGGYVFTDAQTRRLEDESAELKSEINAWCGTEEHALAREAMGAGRFWEFDMSGAWLGGCRGGMGPVRTE